MYQGSKMKRKRKSLNEQQWIICMVYVYIYVKDEPWRWDDWQHAWMSEKVDDIDGDDSFGKIYININLPDMWWWLFYRCIMMFCVCLAWCMHWDKKWMT